MIGASLVVQRIKRLPAMRETWVQSLGWEDPLEKDMATHSSILAWRIPWTEEPDGLQSMESQRDGHDWATSHTHGMINIWGITKLFPKVAAQCHILTSNILHMLPHLWLSSFL